jgi:hypothetical protein
VAVRFNTKLGDKTKNIILQCLLDSGASSSLITEEYVKNMHARFSKGKHTTWISPAGEMMTTSVCQTRFAIPEFHRDRIIEWKLHVAKNLGAYDMILGRDVLSGLGIKFNFADNTIEWDNSVIPMKDADKPLMENYYVQEPAAVASSLKAILDAKYNKADLEEICKNAEHLEPEEREKKLYAMLKEREHLFDGTLGKWKMGSYEIELRDGATPYHARAFPIPKAYTKTLRVEVDRLCEVGVLKKVNQSEWAAPTFIIPKKDGTVRFISDFRKLNKRIKRKPYPIPKIQDMLLTLEGFKYATSLDLNMGYYHIELSPLSKQLCTIVLPWGKYEYQRLPMGLCNSPDIFQEKMSELMADLEYVRAYIGDLLIITNGDFDDHLNKLREALVRLEAAGLKVNALKSFFGKGELEYLGYWITQDGIQPVPAKIIAISNIATPKNRRELRRFIGMVNYYRDMWVRRSDVLAPLAHLTSKSVKWEWKTEH